MAYEKLKKIAVILLIIVLFSIIIFYGKPLLIPLVFAALLSSLLLPVCTWFERKGLNKALSILLSMLLLLSFFGGLIALLGWQVSDITKDSSKIEEEITSKYYEIRQYISETLGVSQQRQEEMIKEQKSSGPGKLSGIITGIIAGIGGFLTDFILTLVYIFLFLFFRGHLKRFIVRLVPEKDKANALNIVNSSQKVTQKYLTGLSLMIVSLWIMYGIGFTIAGVKSAVFFAILCGLLEIIPFIGNIVGTSLTVLFSVIQGGGTNLILGILITYALVQFIQTYVIEPLVVGAEVNLNPLFTILALVVGETFWGIPGMVLSIPLMGITKIICDHIEPLKPYGELIGGNEKKGESGFKKKMKGVAKKIKKLF